MASSPPASATSSRARVTGNVQAPSPPVRPPGVTLPAGQTALKDSVKPLNLIVFADTDMLSDYLWVREQNFFGQRMTQAWASNGDLVQNALDNLAGSADLISVRGRATFTRPFERVEKLRRAADERFHAKEQELEQQLRDTETSSPRCSRRTTTAALILTPEQEQELEHFQTEKLRIRKELRAVRAGLDEEIKRLGTTLKILNIVVVPVVFALAALLDRGLAPARRRTAVGRRGRGGTAMTARRVAVLLAAGLAVIAFAIWLSSRRHLERDPGGRRWCCPGSSSSVNAVTEVRLRKGDGTRTTLKKDSARLAGRRARLARRLGKVRKLVLDLGALNIVEEKTRLPANYPAARGRGCRLAQGDRHARRVAAPAKPGRSSSASPRVQVRLRARRRRAAKPARRAAAHRRCRPEGLARSHALDITAARVREVEEQPAQGAGLHRVARQEGGRQLHRQPAAERPRLTAPRRRRAARARLEHAQP